MRYDVVSLGPARMDVFVFLPEDEITETCSIDKQACMISLGFGDKIPVTKMEFCIGGNTGNNAVGLSRLGFKAAMVGTMGDHWIDRQALEILKSENVNVDHMTHEPNKFGFGVIINYQGERTILSYYPESECMFKIGEGLEADWVYLTTAGKNYDCFYEDAVKWAKSINARIVFNPGSRQIKDGVEKIRYAYEAAELIFVNKEESRELLGKDHLAEVRELLDGLRSLGPKIAVVTDGPAGSYVSDGEKYLFMPIVDAPIVERTGAGDAFGSGFMAAHMAGKVLVVCLR